MSEPNWTAEAVRWAGGIARSEPRPTRGVIMSDPPDFAVAFVPVDEASRFLRELADAGIQILGEAYSEGPVLEVEKTWTALVRSGDHGRLAAIVLGPGRRPRGSG
jgi:hypothetical protein